MDSDNEGKRLGSLLYLSRGLPHFPCSTTLYSPPGHPPHRLSTEKLPSELCLNRPHGACQDLGSHFIPLGDKGRGRCDSDTACAPEFPFYRFKVAAGGERWKGDLLQMFSWDKDFRSRPRRDAVRVVHITCTEP